MYHYTNLRIAGIPCLQFDPPSEPKGTVVLYHGWSSTAQSYSFFASVLSHWGYRIIVPELPHHGERGTLNYADPAALEKHFWDIVFQGIQETENLIAELDDSFGPIGMIGHSMGGFITVGTFVNVPRIRSATVINSSCAWERIEELLRDMRGAPPMTDSGRAALSKRDPIHRLRFEDGRGLLLLHGKDDTVVPIEGQRFFMAAMEPKGISPDQLQFIEFPGVNHQITLSMVQKSVEWLEKHL